MTSKLASKLVFGETIDELVDLAIGHQDLPHVKPEEL